MRTLKPAAIDPALGLGVLLCTLLCTLLIAHFFSDDVEPLAAPIVLKNAALARPTANASPIGLAQKTSHLQSDPLEQSEDLRSLYEQNKQAQSEEKLQLAYRAWRTCIPNFFGTQAAAMARQMQTLADSDARLYAFRQLQQRCKNFSGFSEAELARQSADQQQLWRSGHTKTAAEKAATLLSSGDIQAALALEKAVIASGDLYQIAALHGYKSAYLRNQNGEDERAANDQILASAYTVAACQMGLECGHSSVRAMEHCLYSGQCQGDLIQRYLNALESPAARQLLLTESKKILDLVQATGG
jgi:hypothetical protein